MKQGNKLLIVCVVGLLLTSSCSSKNPATPALPSVNLYGAAAADNDTDLTLEDMLKYAIEDEYLARGEYKYILDTFGDIIPFKDVMAAEVQHIADVKILLEKYKFTVPKDVSEDHLIKADNAEQTYEIGVQAELDNIAMYENFLKNTLPEDIATTFEFLMEASRGHLNAFEKELTR